MHVAAAILDIDVCVVVSFIFLLLISNVVCRLASYCFRFRDTLFVDLRDVQSWKRSRILGCCLGAVVRMSGCEGGVVRGWVGSIGLRSIIDDRSSHIRCIWACSWPL